MLKKIICIQIFILLPVSFTFGQSGNSFYLVPHLGMELPFTYFENKNTIPPFIRSDVRYAYLRLGLSVYMDFQRKFLLELGYGLGTISSHGLRYKSQTDSAAFRTSGGRYGGTEMHRLFFKIHLPIDNIIIPRSGKRTSKYTDQKFYWAIFDVNLIAGMASENMAKTNWSSGLGINRGSFTGSRDIISLYESSITVLNDTGYGLQLGLDLQFYNNGKRRLKLGFFYHQGINRRLKATWSSSINGTPFPDFDISSRGSMLAFYTAYPILLLGKNR